MSLRFWDLGRSSGPSDKATKWLLVTAIPLAMLALYAVVSSSRVAYGILAAVAVIVFLVLLSPRAQEIAERDEQRPRQHQTLDPVPWGALPKSYRWAANALIVGILIALAFFSLR